VSVARADQQRNLRNSQIIAGLYSLVFLSVLWLGYYLLFQKNTLAAIALATVLALTAWFLAKFIGNHENGIRRFWPLFGLLLIISAVGVFNSLMLNLEGRRIFAETIEDSAERFTALDAVAVRALSQKGVGRHIDKVEELRSALIREINNPLNCGQGSEARRIISELRRELPGFVPLSSTGIDCSKNEEVIVDYNSRIDELIKRAPWNDLILQEVRENAASANTELQKLGTRAAALMAPGLLSAIAPRLTGIDMQYRQTRNLLTRRDLDVSALPAQLNMTAVNSLGEWSQLLNLIIDRLDRISTYLYLALAVLFDWMMVYLFGLVRQNKPRRGQNYSTSSIQRAW
jgi:hypothetical protein